MSPRSLQFSALFQEAVDRWPQELRLRRVELPGGRQIVEGLLELEEEISAAAVGTRDEVIFRTLHWAILCAAQEAFRRSDVVRPEELKAATRALFASSLADGETTPELGWSDADRALARRYFEANAEAA